MAPLGASHKAGVRPFASGFGVFRARGGQVQKGLCRPDAVRGVHVVAARRGVLHFGGGTLPAQGFDGQRPGFGQGRGLCLAGFAFPPSPGRRRLRTPLGNRPACGSSGWCAHSPRPAWPLRACVVVVKRASMIRSARHHTRFSPPFWCVCGRLPGLWRARCAPAAPHACWCPLRLLWPPPGPAGGSQCLVGVAGWHRVDDWF